MRAVIQRVTRCSVSVENRVIGEIGAGLLVLLGVAHDDTEKDAAYLAEKTVQLRIFEDESGRMNRSLVESGGAMMVVSQFTLLGDCRKGRRPSFVAAAPPEKAERLYNCFIEQVRGKGIQTATGRFRTMMQVALVNDGPVTLVVESQ
jgi:D-tyrosyl-tRNA(Tyr) deacylase